MVVMSCFSHACVCAVRLLHCRSFAAAAAPHCCSHSSSLLLRPRCAGSPDSDCFRLFVDDLKDDDHELVMATTHRMDNVALLMGQQRTRSELIPFLLEYVEQDSDEAHTSIARHLGDFTEVNTTTTESDRQAAPMERGRQSGYMNLAHAHSRLSARVVQLVGGSANVSILLPLLEKLCSEEETTVRDAVSGHKRDKRGGSRFVAPNRLLHLLIFLWCPAAMRL